MGRAIREKFGEGNSHSHVASLGQQKSSEKGIMSPPHRYSNLSVARKNWELSGAGLQRQTRPDGQPDLRHFGLTTNERSMR